MEPREVPDGAGDRDTEFPIDGPDVPATVSRSKIGRAGSLPGYNQCVRIIIGGLTTVLTANRKGDRSAGQWEQVTG